MNIARQDSAKAISTVIRAILAFALVVISGTAYADENTSTNSKFFSFAINDFPYFYGKRFDARATVEYTKSGSDVIVNTVDMITWIENNDGNYAGLRFTINVDVLDENGRLVKTLYPESSGSYLFGPNHLYYGGISRPNLRIKNPTFRPRIMAIANAGLGWQTLQWDFKLSPLPPVARRVSFYNKLSNRWLCAENGGRNSPVMFNRINPDIWEAFVLIDINGGSLRKGDPVFIQSVISGWYLTVEDVFGRKDVIWPGRSGVDSGSVWETFYIDSKETKTNIISSGSDISFISKKNGLRWRADFNDQAVVKANTNNYDTWETFRIVFR